MKKRGFTLTELLVVIGLIALLVGIVMVAVNNFRDSARMLECQSNQHQLQVGLYGYSMEHGGKFISPKNYQDAANQNPDLFWVKSDNSRRDPVTMDETLASLQDGALWEYVGDEAAYRSPLDPTGRMRSYSLNGFISDLPDNSSNPAAQWAPVADRLSKIKIPSNTIYVLPEEDRDWEYRFNRHGWVIDVNLNWWKDYPVDWLPEATTTAAFVDGSTRVLKFQNPNLVEAIGGHEQAVTPETEGDFKMFADFIRVDR
ncbi:MAG: type II secretion system GspH family protein [Phycisphaerales bacterium]|nr:type II secretion system GspH family protein [Phycisphaerales bacterium]